MFSQKLKDLRKQYGLTQSQLANKLGLGVSTIGMYESDIRKPSYTVIKKIADYFNVTIDYLISDDTNQDIEDTDELIAFAKNIKKLSPKQKEQIKSFINYIIQNPPK